MSGAAISDFLEKKVVCPKIITKVFRHPRHLELLCRTVEETTAILADLKEHQVLSEDLTFQIKSPPLFRVILFVGVPEGTELKYILKTIDEIYYFDPEDVTFLRTTPSRLNKGKDWHFMMHENLARAIIKDGGIPLGFTTCKLRPSTSVQRCRKCQSYGHIEKYCRNPEACENCGGPHNATTCTTRPNCLNCNRSNRLYHAEYSTNHKASASHCPTFRFEYGRERSRLDEIFELGRRNPFPEEALDDFQRGPGILGDHPPPFWGTLPGEPHVLDPPPHAWHQQVARQWQNPGRRF